MKNLPQQGGDEEEEEEVEKMKVKVKKRASLQPSQGAASSQEEMATAVSSSLVLLAVPKVCIRAGTNPSLSLTGHENTHAKQTRSQVWA